MSWHPSIPLFADDETGTTWEVRRVWFGKKPGDYLLEVVTPGRTGVRAAISGTGTLNWHP